MKIYAFAMFVPVMLALAATAFAHHHSEQEAVRQPALTAGPNPDAAVLRYDVRDGSGTLIPCRLTFVNESGPPPNLFPNFNAAPDELAVRQNLVYTLRGDGAVTVPAGRYTVYASRGLEWSIDKQSITLENGKEAAFAATLKHEVDTTGWISGDFHLHTLTHSGHGDANMKERIITFVGEGLEFAVATDHNHNTDYEPTARALGVGARVATAVGNEITTSIGHINAFPLDPERPIPPPQSYDANVLFKIIREEPNQFGVTPVIQLNHPRWGGMDYFGLTKLDPVTGIGGARSYSPNFDTIELLNENDGWGYYDADIETAVPTLDSRHWALRDWFNLLNRGHRYAAVGNSDSHTVQAELAGYPRNFVHSATDDPSAIRVADVATALRGMQSFTTIGPFVSFSANGKGLGALATAKGGRVELAIRVQAASWIDCDRVKIIVNGDLVDTLPVADRRDVLRLDARHALTLKRDAWIALCVEGDDPLAPIVHTQDRPIRPLAIINPVYVDVDGDGKFTCPRDLAERLLRANPSTIAPDEYHSRLPSEKGLLILTAAELGHVESMSLVSSGLTASERVVKLATLRAAEKLADAGLKGALKHAFEQHAADAYMQISALRALKACEPASLGDSLLAFLDASDARRLSKYADDLEDILPGEFAREWNVVGYFPNPGQGALSISCGPEAEGGATDFAAKGGGRASWQPLAADKKGFLDLRRIDGDKKLSENAVAFARTFLHSPDDRTLRITLGSDDGSRVWVNDTLVHDDPTRHAASPLQAIVKVQVRKGWNRVLFKVENGGSGFGLYCRALDPQVRWAGAPD